MRTVGLTNKLVAELWAKGFAGKSNNGNFHTDGKDLFSYEMRIGRTNADGKKEMITVRHFSPTTDEHVRYAMRYAEIITEPIKVNKLTNAVVVGWQKKISKLDWYYFPDDLPEETKLQYVVTYGENVKPFDTYQDAKTHIRELRDNGKKFTAIVGLNVLNKYINKFNKPFIVAKYGKDYVTVQMVEMKKS